MVHVTVNPVLTGDGVGLPLCQATAAGSFRKGKAGDPPEAVSSLYHKRGIMSSATPLLSAWRTDIRSFPGSTSCQNRAPVAQASISTADEILWLAPPVAPLVLG